VPPHEPDVGEKDELCEGVQLAIRSVSPFAVSRPYPAEKDQCGSDGERRTMRQIIAGRAVYQKP
jgi:hypothetical protein